MQSPYPNSNPSLSGADAVLSFKRSEEEPGSLPTPLPGFKFGEVMVLYSSGQGLRKSRLTEHLIEVAKAQGRPVNMIDLDGPRPAGMKTRLTYDLMVEADLHPRYVSLEMRETELVRHMKAAFNQGGGPTGQGEDTPIKTTR